MVASARMVTMQVTLIVNTFATSVTARSRVVIAKAISADHQLNVVETKRGGHATKLAEAAARDGAEVVVSLGGDGTLNECANGLIGTTTALAALPGGSTNVFARSIGMTNDPIEAVGELLEALAIDSIRPINLGYADVGTGKRYFLFHLGMRFDADVVEWVEDRGELKRLAGHPMFAYSIFRTWLRTAKRETPMHVELSKPGASVTPFDSAWLVALNNNPYTYVGDRPFNVAPNASLDSGLSVLSFSNVRGATIVSAGYRSIFGKHGLGGMRTATQHDDVTTGVMTSQKPIGIEMDGDHIAHASRVEFGVAVDAIRLVMPLND